MFAGLEFFPSRLNNLDGYGSISGDYRYSINGGNWEIDISGLRRMF